MKDRVLIEEREWDAQQTANEVRYEQARPFAEADYEAGDLDDWIQDIADPADTCKIALATLDWVDNFLDSKYETPAEALTALVGSIPVLNLRDFRGVVEQIIEEKTQLIMDEM